MKKQRCANVIAMSVCSAITAFQRWWFRQDLAELGREDCSKTRKCVPCHGVIFSRFLVQLQRTQSTLQQKKMHVRVEMRHFEAHLKFWRARSSACVARNRQRSNFCGRRICDLGSKSCFQATTAWKNTMSMPNTFTTLL